MLLLKWDPGPLFSIGSMLKSCGRGLCMGKALTDIAVVTGYVLLLYHLTSSGA